MPGELVEISYNLLGINCPLFMIFVDKHPKFTPTCILNSLLPLGRYIDMDPCTTELVVSQTQIIRFGQFLLG